MRFMRRLLPVPLCALGAHAVLYRSFFPAGGSHAYFGWYEPFVGALSLGALVALAVLAGAALVGGEGPRRLLRGALSAPGREVSLATRSTRLALASLAFLIAQETLEHSLALGRPSAAAFPAASVLVLPLALAAISLTIALVERSCRQLVALALGRASLPRVYAVLTVLRALRPARVRRRHPLASLRGLRAPPLPAG
jgi:hypothetical protein